MIPNTTGLFHRLFSCNSLRSGGADRSLYQFENVLKTSSAELHTSSHDINHVTVSRKHVQAQVLEQVLGVLVTRVSNVSAIRRASHHTPHI